MNQNHPIKSESLLPSEPQVRSSEWFADINESETKAWDNMRAKEDQLQRATEELREATRSWSMQYSKLREAMKQQMSANGEVSDGGPLTDDKPAAQSRRSLH